jgi:hypothetical protein
MNERERFEMWAKKSPNYIYWNTSDAAYSAWCYAVSVEREECAKTCENDESGRDGGGYYADRIRERSNASS